MRSITYILIFAVLVLLEACSPSKYVADGDMLLDDIKIEVDGNYPDINVGQLKSYVHQRGNSRWFGAFKIPLSTYSLSGRDSAVWINRVLRRMGEEPVIYDSLKTMRSCMDLRTALQNQGYLHATVDADTVTLGTKKTRVKYTLHPGDPFYIKGVSYDIRDSVVARTLAQKGVTENRLTDGMRFNVNRLNDERKHITDILLNNGYYKFNKDFISYTADTLRGDSSINLTLHLMPYRTHAVADTLHPFYRIGKIRYIPGVTVDGNADDKMHLRLRVLRNNTSLREGMPYSSNDLQNTYNNFGRLSAVRYTNIDFKEYPGNILDCNIQVSTNKPHTISFEPEGTNTAGDLGAAASLTYQNSNLFRGSELLSVQVRGAYEAIHGLEGYSNSDFVEYGVEARLSFPRFLLPFASTKFLQRSDMSTQLSVMYDNQNRPEYHRRVLNAALKYKWANAGHHDRYQVDLIDMSYVYMPWISETFRKDYLEDNNNRNAILRYNYENMLIMKLGLGYIYNNGTRAIKLNLESAGNLLGAFAKLANTSKNELGQYRVMNIAFAQYAKADIDYTRNIRLDYNSQLVLHAALGIAYPYGNSKVLPFEKRYFSGGANSVRGWSVRSLGPGKFRGTDGNIDFINQTGDLKLDLNMEYRAHLFWKFNGAVFIDAGNIWTLRNYEEQPGGQFKIDEFWKQIAVGYGAGVRLNFDYFIVRFDFGMKAVNPAYENHRDHYPIVHPRLSRDLTFHFAIGYPF